MHKKTMGLANGPCWKPVDPAGTNLPMLLLLIYKSINVKFQFICWHSHF